LHQKLGLDLTILSGDRLAAVAPVAKELGIANWQAGIVTTLDNLKWGWQMSLRQRGNIFTSSTQLFPAS
jgi:hypothetical protein